MKKREGVYDLYWQFAYERQEVFYKRFEGKPQPWTNDTILQNYKFTNVYRVSDRVSQFLLRNVIYTPKKYSSRDMIYTPKKYSSRDMIYTPKKYSSRDMIFRIILFKLFNKESTWEFLESNLGDITLDKYSFDLFDSLLSDKSKWGPIYSSAYISCANKVFGYHKKHQNHLKLLEKMFFEDKLDEKITSANSFKEVFKLLVAYPLIGNFMAYQLATDINYSEVIDFDEDSFVIHGPGSKRGIDKCFEDRGGKSYEEVILYMLENQENEFNRLGLKFRKLGGKRPLKAIDCQNIFCEVDKYLREKRPELASNRGRIKAKFKENKKKIDYTYPPKWGLT